MNVTKDTRLRVTKNLLALERDSDELVMTNSFVNRPLYISEGKEYIKKFLSNVDRLETTDSIVKAFPRDRELLEVLTSYKIVVPQKEDETASEAACAGCKEGPGDGGFQEMSLYLLLSQSCNMGCVYCLNGTETYKKDKSLKMTDAVAFRSVEWCLDHIVDGGKLEIVFFGGEPLLNWDLAKKVIVRCEEVYKKERPNKSIGYNLTSNLARIPPDLIDWGKKHEIGFLCDIDGPEEVHNRLRPYLNGRPTFRDITDNVRRIVDSGLVVSLRTTVTALNQDQIIETTRVHKELGAVSSAFVPMNPINSDEEIYLDDLLPSPRKLVEGLSRILDEKIWDFTELFPFNTYLGRVSPGAHMTMGCGAPFGNILVVDAQGEAYPCIYLVGIGRYHVGNVFDDSFPNRGVFDAMSDILHVEKREDCRSCPWRYLCAGGCPVGKLIVMDNPKATDTVLQYTKDINCYYTRTVLEMLLWETAKRSAEFAGRPAPGRVEAAGPYCA